APEVGVQVRRDVERAGERLGFEGLVVAARDERQDLIGEVGHQINSVRQVGSSPGRHGLFPVEIGRCPAGCPRRRGPRPGSRAVVRSGRGLRASSCPFSPATRRKMMLTLFTWTSEGPSLCFSFALSPLDYDGWEHVVPEAVVASCYDETLLPLVSERGDQLTAEEVMRAVIDRAAQAHTAPIAIDWLGLALYAALRFRLATMKLLNDDPAKHQEECRRANLLATTLKKIYARLAEALYPELLRVTSRVA